MNKIIILGRLVKDPELRKTEDGERVFTRFTVAVEQNFKAIDGTRKADFIPVVIWGKKAEIICKYLKKSDFISISGRLRACSYDDAEGKRKYIAEVVGEDFKFITYNKKEIENEILDQVE